MNTKTDNSANMEEPSPARAVPARQAQAARVELDRALSLHLRGEKASAIKSLRKALALDPNLAEERLPQNLAHELTGLPAQEAFITLAADETRQELVRAARQEQKPAPTPFRPSFSAVALVLALTVLLGMSFWSFRTGVFSNALARYRRLQWETQKQSLGGYDYYALVPSGSPPEEGWPVVVAFHGMGGKGEHMLGFAQTFLDNGVLFVAPTFGDYSPWPNGPIEVMSRILKEIDKNHPLRARGAVLLGHSQGGTFAYRFSVYYPEQVAGVVTAGAPEFDAIVPARASMPYVLTWGERDFLLEMASPTAIALRSSGYNVSVYSVANAEHEMTQFAVDKALSLLVGP